MSGPKKASTKTAPDAGGAGNDRNPPRQQGKRKPGNLKAGTSWAGLPLGAMVLVDSAPIIYLLEGNAQFLPTYLGLFEADASGQLRIAISTITLAEVLTGPLRAGQDALAQRYEKALSNHLVVPVNSTIAAMAARLRARYRLKLPDAIQLATALDIEAAALVTHDRDFAKVEGLVIIGGTPSAPFD